ncbi:MAG: sulfatase [Planctomycetota bacterium]
MTRSFGSPMFCKQSLLSFAVAFLLTSVSLGADRPNIVFVIADDCTFRDIGCYGGQAYTPNIDRLAEEGMRLTRCFQSAPMCSPTRHNIYTGQYPVKSGAYPNHTFVDPETKSIVQYLRPLGYRVGQSGKTHVSPNSVFAWERLGNGKNPDFEAVDQFIGDCKQAMQPFCLLLCSNEPHSPWNKGDASRYPPDQVTLPPYLFDTPEMRDAFSRYLAEITYYDSQVGEAMALLERYELTGDTLLVVVSEQGNSFPFAKWTCYDSGLQSACLARWPGKIRPGSENAAMIEYVDFLPTFIELAGGTPARSLDGKSLVQVFQGKPEHKQYVFGEMTTRGINNGSDYYGIRSIRSEQYKLIWNFSPEVTFQNACTNSKEFQSWVKAAKQGSDEAEMLVQRYTKRPRFELYDVLSDPLESRNLVDDGQYEQVIDELQDELQAWMKRCGDLGQETEMNALQRQGRARKAAAKR